VNAEGWTLIGVALGAAIAIIGSLAVASFQIRAAVTQRRQEWREKAYVDAFAVLNRQRQLIALSWPIITPSQAPPPLLPDEVVEAAEAKLESHSSREMRAVLDRWIDRRTAFFSLGAEIDSGSASAKTAQELVAVRAELVGDKPGGGIIGEIAAQIRKELGYKD
jgi:type II secretory pathway pseudopilin PulG